MLDLLPLPAEPLNLLNPGPLLRMRRLDLPDGALWIVLNGGEPAVARLHVAQGIRLVRLTSLGEVPLESKGEIMEISAPGQDALVLRMWSPA